MLTTYFVRLGVFGQVGRLNAAVATSFRRGRRVVCRTTRGVEVGEVLGGAAPHAIAPDPQRHADGTVLRYLTTEDELVLARIQRNRDRAFDECVRLLRQRRLDATLVDVEHLFDGQSLYFYFWGEVTPEIDRLTRDLAEAYEAKVQFRQFTDAVERGCGPACGTESATGCGSTSGCSTCAIAAACGHQG